MSLPYPDPAPMVRMALAEDIGSGDLTAELIPADSRSEATVISREAAVVCGAPWFDEVYRQLDPSVVVEWAVSEGQLVEPNQLLCTVRGASRSLLSGERSALNFLQALSGTATLARRYADVVAGTHAKVLDTRKTIPGLRLAQKYAVRCGGCTNHRIGLYDAILIKENHILAAGSIGAAIEKARRLHPNVKLEVEVEDLSELEQALAGQPDVIMLDNFDLALMRQAVEYVQRRVPLEASGNVNLQTIRAIAETGVDYISIGGLTKDLKAIDLSMRFRDL